MEGVLDLLPCSKNGRQDQEYQPKETGLWNTNVLSGLRFDKKIASKNSLKD